MLKSRLFWKLFLVYVVLTAVVAGTFVAILAGRQRDLVRQQLLRRLRDTAFVLRSEARGAFPSGERDLQRRLQVIGAHTGTRLTLIAADGRVLGDSAANAESMENHLDRPEVQRARLADEGIGISERSSSTLELPMLYYALRIGDQNEPLGFVRVAMEMADVEDQVGHVKRLIWATAAAACVAALVVTWWLIGRVTRPLTTLTAAAQGMAEGELDQTVAIHRRDELGQLATAFNAMSRELARRVEELEGKSRQLEENSQRLETVLGGMVEGVIAIDARERVLFANQAARRMFGHRDGELVGRPIWEAIRIPALQQSVRQVLEGHEQTAHEFELPRRRSTVSMIAARLPGRPCPGLVLVFHDVSELRRLESQRRDFVSNVSHELKTPLTAIQVLSETLLEGALEDPRHNRRFVEQIAEQAERLYALILDLLRLAQIESGREVYDVRSIDLREPIEACAKEHTAVAESKGVILETHPPDEEVHIRADDEGLRTIVDNLVDNALEHTPAGGRVAIRWGRQDHQAVIAVEDTGVGIPAEHQDRIFERFYRVDRARSRERGGTGLGLSIVKHLTQLFGGTVEVSSLVGKGSTFTLRFPLEAPAVPQPVSAGAPTHQPHR
ncbi:MAG: HAMP domain-containing protein [Planctomycetes bacterium]|nr:HAMP domain-containing protein [Planctomycetota bacterium]